MQTDLPQLRPMDIGDLLNTTFQLYRRNFSLFAGIVAVLLIPETILGVLVGFATSTSSITGASFGTALGLGGLSGIVTLVFSQLITGALAQAIAARYLGREITISEAYASIGGATLVTLVAVAILEGIFVGIGLILLVIPGIYLIVRFAFVPQAVVLERTGVFAAFSRSGDLVKGSWWRVFGIGLVVVILVAVLQGIAVSIVAGAVFLGHGSGTGFATFTRIVSGIVGIFVQPIQLGALTLLYYELRVRKEGFDLER